MAEWTSRREFMSSAMALPALAVRLPVFGLTKTHKPLRFGVIADVHHGLASRAEERLEDFLSECSRRKLDFIAQLGDFNHPLPEARSFLKLWHSYKGARHSVLGNHDMDLGSKAQAVESWRIPGRYYSFDSGFLHFVILDANFMRPSLRSAIIPDRPNTATLRVAGGLGSSEPEARSAGANLEVRAPQTELVPYDNGNWYRSGITASWIDPEQIEWLRSDLAATRNPTIVLVHQMLDEIWEGGAVPNRAEVRRVLEESGKVVAVIQGHAHQDAHEIRNGILYWRVNSASYAWVGEKYGRMAHYDRSLYAFVEVAFGGDLRFVIGDSPGAGGSRWASDSGLLIGASAAADLRLRNAGQESPITNHRSHTTNRESRFANLGSPTLTFRAEGRRGAFEGESPFARGVPNPDRFASKISSLDETIPNPRVRARIW